jgi:hypothetical protein
MCVGIGLGCAVFPFSGAAAYWRWVDMCEAGGVDSIWQTDGDDDTLLAQARQLIEQVLPRAEARWPKHPKTSDL